MLQISTGKFFNTAKLHETPYRGVYYTNYRSFDCAKIETPVGVLLPSNLGSGVSTLTYEVVERIEAHPNSPVPGEVISTGGDVVANDFAAVISFALGITCTTNSDLTERLIDPRGSSLGNAYAPSKFIPRMFDGSVLFARGDDDNLSAFVKNLIALDRRHYEGAIRAIRRYVTGAHRIADDVNLAYALFVMSIESLAQEFDGHVTEWSDYDEAKRSRIDAALDDATSETAEKVRQAILRNEHVALARRFRTFTLAHVTPSYFRGEAAQVQGAISRPDLEVALRQAYEIRSGYVHRLQEINAALVGMPALVDAIELEGRHTFTFAGIARLARHVIMQFIEQGPKVARETFDYWSVLPHMLRLPVSPQYWIDKPDGLSVDNAHLFLSALLTQIAGVLLTGAGQYSDLRALLEKIEGMLPGLAKPRQRLPLLTLYYLFHQIAPKEFHRPLSQAFLRQYEDDFADPSIESLIARLIGQVPISWTLDALESLHQTYLERRSSRKATRIGRFFEAAIALYLADAHRSHDQKRSRELVAFAVESMPNHAGLLAFEPTVLEESIPPINWISILCPPTPRPEVALN
jgi:hypothetical protein